MKFIDKLLCKLLGHKWRPKLKDMYCIRCGVSRPKTLEEQGYKISECEGNDEKFRFISSTNSFNNCV